MASLAFFGGRGEWLDANAGHGNERHGRPGRRRAARGGGARDRRVGPLARPARRREGRARLRRGRARLGRGAGRDDGSHALRQLGVGLLGARPRAAQARRRAGRDRRLRPLQDRVRAPGASTTSTPTRASPSSRSRRGSIACTASRGRSSQATTSRSTTAWPTSGSPSRPSLSDLATDRTDRTDATDRSVQSV